MAPGDRRSNRVNPFAEPSTQGLASSGPGCRRSNINANPFPMSSMQDEAISSGPGVRRSNRVNSNPFAEPSMQGPTSSGPGGRRSNISANLFPLPSMQDEIISSGPGGRRSTIEANLFPMPSTQDETIRSGPGGRRSTINADPIRMPDMQDGTTSFGKMCLAFVYYNLTFDTHAERIFFTHTRPRPGGKRSTINANAFLMPDTQDRTTSSRSGGRRSTPNANPFSMPSTNHVSGGGRSSSNSNPISMHNTQDGATTSGTKKNVRKKSVNKKLTEHLRMGGARPRIEILPELTAPLRPWARSWCTEIGITVRQHVPLRYHTWKEVKTEKGLQPLFEQLLKSFDVDFSQPHVVSAVDGHLKKLYKDYRHELHRYYLALPDNIDKTQYAAADVGQEDWELLCAWWETDEYKRKSTTNKRSRSKLEVLHRGGCKKLC